MVKLLACVSEGHCGMEGSDGCLPRAAHATSLYTFPVFNGHSKLLVHKILAEQISWSPGARYACLLVQNLQTFDLQFLINPASDIALHLIHVYNTPHKNSEKKP